METISCKIWDGVMPFPWALPWTEMETDLSRILTQR